MHCASGIGSMHIAGSWLNLLVAFVLIFVAAGFSIRAQDVPCRFDDASLSYEGSPAQQARCLMRPVLKGGHLGPPLKKLPSPLDNLIGKPTDIEPAVLKQYLEARGIAQSDVGGSIVDPVSRANPTDPQAPPANYFVIHDVSTPNYLNDPFPADINESTWSWNGLNQKWIRKKVTHVYISRTGQSVTAVDFKEQLPDPNHGTKFARDYLRNKGKGLYLHIELVQPRRRDPGGSAMNDAIAPNPGFTLPQLKRLALVYIAASHRRGVWMIPAFHAAIDVGIPDAHDDPQNFDTDGWADQLRLILKELKAIKQERARH